MLVKKLCRMQWKETGGWLKKSIGLIYLATRQTTNDKKLTSLPTIVAFMN